MLHSTTIALAERGSRRRESVDKRRAAGATMTIPTGEQIHPGGQFPSLKWRCEPSAISCGDDGLSFVKQH